MKRRSSRSFAGGICVVLVALAAVVPAAEKESSPQTQRTRRTAPARRLQPIQLPKSATSGAVSFEQVVAELGSVELPGSQRLDLAKISQLAWAAQAVMPPSVATPTTPAPAPTEPPMRAYFVLPEGLFAYESASHTLQPVSDGDNRAALAAALLKRAVAPIGGCQIIVAASVRDFTSRYRTQGRTVMALQAGKVSQNIQLQAIAEGLAFVNIDAVEGGDIRRIVRMPRTYDPLYVAIIGYPASQTPETAVQPTVPQTGGRVLLVVPPRGFQDQELLLTRRALELAGAQVTVASSRAGTLTGMLGGTIQGNVLLNQASVDNFDTVVFIGGIGVAEYLGNPIAQNLARQAAAQGKILAAIGTAPSILANAGALRGVRATGYLTEQARIIQGGAVYTGNPAEKDGLIITATGPQAAQLFAQAILEGLGAVSQ